MNIIAFIIISILLIILVFVKKTGAKLTKTSSVINSTILPPKINIELPFSDNFANVTNIDKPINAARVYEPIPAEKTKIKFNKKSRVRYFNSAGVTGEQFEPTNFKERK